MIRSRIFFIFLFCTAAVVVTAAVSLGVARQTLSLASTSPHTEYLYIEPGDGLNVVAYKAKKLGLVRRAWHFVIAAKILGRETDLKAGEYELTAHSMLSGIINKIGAGEVYYRKIIVPEGLSVAQVEMEMTATRGLDWTGYIPPEEGSILPETYFFTRGERASELIARMQQSMRRELDEMWRSRAPGLPVKTKEQALILASIVEKETGVAMERPLVAAVFNNRLKKRMRLQSDPTVVYGITLGEPLGRSLTSADLKNETAYNTYRVGGLPPTAIANPGRQSIAAVLSPAPVDYLYFVADGTGGHAFAVSLKDHNRNVARWRKFQAAQKR